MSKIEVNQISSQCGSTLTIGQSGDTVTLACGATAAGFGRTGTVNWDTTAKTASFTAVSGNGYFVNTTSGAITVTLPASPSAGDIVAIFDYARTFATNNVTIGRNSSLIQGAAADGTISTNGQSTTFVYVDGTKGWVPTEDQTTGNYGAQYVTATGGTITTCGDYKIHTFTGPGTFCVSCAGNAAGSNTVDYLVVAGGGGGGNYGGGAGGAGGFRLSNSTCMPVPLTSPLATPTALPVSVTGYPITVGSGGAGGCGPNSPGSPACAPQQGSPGSNSVFSSITSAGGGGGNGVIGVGKPGGSGGGGKGTDAVPAETTCAGFPGGTGNTPPVSPPQGNPGGYGYDGGVSSTNGGGGGGAGAAGGNTNTIRTGGNGAIGSYVVSAGFAGCNGEAGPVCGARYFSGGGGGGTDSSASVPGGVAGTGGFGGGGNGGSWPSCVGLESGSANTGGGGGGGGANPALPHSAGSGGSGIVIIRYKYQ